MQLRKHRKIQGKPQVLAQQRHGAWGAAGSKFAQKSNDSPTRLNERGAVQPADVDCSLPLGSEPADGAIGIDAKMLFPSIGTRINRQCVVLLDGIAATACIDHIVVLSAPLRMRRPRLNMVHAEGVVAVGAPSLSPKAIDAPEAKLVAQPRLVGPVIDVA